jgi:Tfp pilus assembly major pilin PilA
MAIQVQGNGGTVLEVEANTRALRTTSRPTDVGALGAYSWGGLTGVIPAALAANSEILQFRWIDASKLCVLRSIRMSACVSTTFFAAGVPVQIEARLARSWSADGTGGTAQVFSTANTNKKRTSFALSAFSDTGVRIATTAALGAGTKTLDTNPLASLLAPGPITASLNGQVIPPNTILWERDTADEWPVVLAQNEGFVVRSVAVPATGTWQAAFSVEWMELTSF